MGRQGRQTIKADLAFESMPTVQFKNGKDMAVIYPVLHGFGITLLISSKLQQSTVLQNISSKSVMRMQMFPAPKSFEQLSNSHSKYFNNYFFPNFPS